MAEARKWQPLPPLPVWMFQLQNKATTPTNPQQQTQTTHTNTTMGPPPARMPQNLTKLKWHTQHSHHNKYSTWHRSIHSEANSRQADIDSRLETIENTIESFAFLPCQIHWRDRKHISIQGPRFTPPETQVSSQTNVRQRCKYRVIQMPRGQEQRPPASGPPSRT